MIARFHLTAPLSHSAFGADAGNATPLRRMRLVSLPGYPDVPVLSGNAIRNGGIRRALMRELFGALDLDRTATLEWDAIYAALANGGTIRRAEKRIDPERIRSVRDAVPALSVLGSALYTWLLPGHCSVGVGWPVCAETVAAGVVTPVDDAPSVADIEIEYTESRLPDREHHDPDVTLVGEMPTTAEVIAPGTVIESRITFAPHAPEVERAAVAHGLTLLTALGGKSAHGLGRFHLDVEGGDAGPYREWLEDDKALAGARAAILAMPETW